MEKHITGYCPVQKKEYTITITYVPDGLGHYEKGIGDCNYNALGNKCNSGDCPISNNAPNEI